MNRSYIVGGLFLIVLLGALIAFASVSLGPVGVPDPSAATQSVVSQVPAQVTRVKGSIGDRVEAVGVALTVTGIEWKESTSASNQEQGNGTLLVHIIAENTNPTFNLEVAAGDFEIRRANGQTIDFSPATVVGDQLVDTTLAPGEKETKTVAFLLPVSEETLHLLYDFNDQHMDIDLGQ